MNDPTHLDPHALRPTTSTYIETQNQKTYNIENSNVTINTVLSQPEYADSAEKMMAVESFSKEYYQLLVTCDADVFAHNYVTVPLYRALGKLYVPEEILSRCSSLSEEGIAELKTFPALICMENEELRGIAGPYQQVVYAYITRIKKEYQVIKVAFHPIGVFQQKILCEKKYAIYFDLDMDCAITDLNHSAWSVHKVNLFKAFNEAGLGYLPHPSKWR